MAREAFKTSDGAVWIQPDGPNTQPQYLGCMNVEDVSAPGNAIDAMSQCFDVNGVWRVVNYTKTKPDPVTFSLETYIGEVQNYLETVIDMGCAVPIHFLLRDGGAANIFTNYKRFFSVGNALIGDLTLSGLAMREDDTEALQGYSVSALPPVIRGFPLTVQRQVTAQAQDNNNIVFCNSPRCASDSGPTSYPCQVGYMAGGFAGAATADVFRTTDYGATWAVTGADPFIADKAIMGMVCIPLTATTHRIIVGRGTTTAATAPQVAYSDDNGASWTLAAVSATVALFFQSPNALFAYDQYNIWGVLDSGKIGKSVDGGKSWTDQTSGVATALHAVHFASDRVGFVAGASDVVLKTLDGGRVWSTMTATGAASTLNTVFALDAQRVWAGSANGQLRYSLDGGATWAQRRFTGDGVGSVKSIKFLNNLVGYMTHDTAAPLGSVHRTFDGGFTWEKLTTPANSGIQNLTICGVNQAWAVGKINTATGFLAKVLN